MLNKKIIIFIILINISLYIFSECLILKNGNIFKGQIINLDKNNVILKVNNKFIKFSFNLIDYLIHNNSQEKELHLIVEKKNRIKEKINLIKFSKKALFYKNQKTNEINFILFQDINIIRLENLNKIQKNIIIQNYSINSEIEINNEMEFIINKIINKKEFNNNFLDNINLITNNESTYIYLNFNDLDFYEKFWNKINKYINKDTQNLLWNLYELYSNKEKYINLINNSKQNNKKSTNSNSINFEIIKLRKEFYYRAKKIIFNNELLINCFMIN